MYFTLKVDSGNYLYSLTKTKDYWRQSDKPKTKISGEDSLPLLGAESELAQVINDNTIIIDFWRIKIGKDIGGGGFSRLLLSRVYNTVESTRVSWIIVK